MFLQISLIDYANYRNANTQKTIFNNGNFLCNVFSQKIPSSDPPPPIANALVLSEQLHFIGRGGEGVFNENCLLS